MKKQILTDVKLSLAQSEKELLHIAEKRLRAKPAYFKILKKSLDARDKENIRYIYTIEFSAEAEERSERELPVLPAERQPVEPVLVVGSGPAGLFCALRLLAHGIRPLVIERGPSVDEREKKLETFFRTRNLDAEGNVQFGEGGAGTFSDGKLNTGTHGAFNREVLESFVAFGAPKEILWLNKPHIGSDNLKKVVRNMREFIIKQGGRVEFNTRLTDILIKDGAVKAVKLKRGGALEETREASAVVLAVGHSARDTFEMLLARGVAVRRKDFAVGARIEHLQAEIGLSQYGRSYPLLPAADYKLVSHASERAAFTFCMCPGGCVVPAASEEGGVVTNGMSNYARNGTNANSALVVQVTDRDFGDGPLAGVEFQRRLERAAFAAGGRTYRAPVQLVGDFLRGRESTRFKSVLPTYAVGTEFADLGAVLPVSVADAMKKAITEMDRKLKGFASPDAVLTAVESRTSSPLRIERGEDLQSVSTLSLYPCGEGAGYAGGITSSASDGFRVAEAIFERFKTTKI